MWAFGRLTPASKRGQSAPRQKQKQRDPLDEFVHVWSQFRECLAAKEESDASNAAGLLGRMLALLIAERAETSSQTAQQDPSILGPCLEYVLKHAILATLVKLTVKDEPEGIRRHVIDWFDDALQQLEETFLTHVAVHSSIVALLQACVDERGGLHRGEEEPIVSLMTTICQRIAQRPDLLAVFLRERFQTLAPDSPGDRDRPSSPALSNSTRSVHSAGPSSNTGSRRHRVERDFVIFSYLLRYVHREGRLGTLARSGLLAVSQLAIRADQSHGRLPRSESTRTVRPSDPRDESGPALIALTEFILDSDFAEVVGAGLGALYGLLPSKLVVRSAQDLPGSTPLEDGSPGLAHSALLGGMGALEEGVDCEEAIARREEENMQLRLMGLVTTDSPEFVESIAIWTELFVFVQEVVDSAHVQDEHEEADSDAGHHAALVRAVVETILSSVQNLFLKNVLYPALLECAESDGSAVAVLNYLDTMFGLLQDGTQLQARIFRYLLGDEAEKPAEDEPRKPRRPIRRKKSSALKLFETASKTAKMSSSAFISEVERFGLKDLVLSHINCDSTATKIAALKLLDTLLRRHDRWALLVLDAQSEPRHVPARTQASDPWDAILSLQASTNPAHDQSYSIKRLASKYVLQAEATFLGHRSLMREVSFFEPTDKPDGSKQDKRRGSKGWTVRKLRVSDVADIDVGLAHRLSCDATSTKAVLDLLSKWFTQTPLLNLAVTAVIADLASDYFRSLEPWLIAEGDLPTLESIDTGNFERPHRDDGDDRSDDYIYEEDSRRRSAFPAPSSKSEVQPLRSGSESVVQILAALVESVETYRRSVDRFDALLDERRKSLVFVDDLADALEGDNSMALPTRPSPETAQALPSTPAKSSRKTSYASFLSPKSATQRISSLISTPSTPVTSRGLPRSSSTTTTGDNSPFADHYRLTGSIRLSPVVVDSPLRRQVNAHNHSRSPSPSASPLLGPPMSDTDTQSDVADGSSIKSAASATVNTLSIVLDNFVVLEEFIKELAALLYVRRSMGML